MTPEAPARPRPMRGRLQPIPPQSSHRLGGQGAQLGPRPIAQTKTSPMLSIAHVWSWLTHVPFLGGALVLLLIWQLAAGRLFGR